MPVDHFGPEVAERYDERTAGMTEPEFLDPIVDFLAELAGDRPALELGIGTGRVALPLAQRGVRVHGIDLSEAMVARLRAKQDAEPIDVTIGDFATTSVDGTFALAYLVANTIMNLVTQDEQVACFRNVAAHLEPGGCFVIEVLVRREPDASRVRRDRRRHPVVDLSSLLDRRWHGPGPLAAVPLRLAVGARPHGAARGDDAPRALGRLDT
jgi:SAM-dependent methyltransferase